MDFVGEGLMEGGDGGFGGGVGREVGGGEVGEDGGEGDDVGAVGGAEEVREGVVEEVEVGEGVGLEG